MSNFHNPGHTGDRRLTRYIQDAKLNNLFGGFMKDVSDKIKTDSRQVKVDPADVIMELIGKVISVDGSKNRFIICLGDKTFDTLRKGLKVPSGATICQTDTRIHEFRADVENESWRVFRVLHSANYGKFIHKSEQELPLQLIRINEQMSLAT